MSNSKFIAKAAIILLMLAVGFLILLCISYFFYGSLEEFPTDENDEKISIVTILLGSTLLVIEIMLFNIYKKIKDKNLK